MAKTDVEQAIDRLKKAMEPNVTPKGKAPQSMGGNPEAKAAVQIPDTDEEDAEPEELGESDVKSSSKKGKVKNQFAGNDGDINEDRGAKKSWGDKLSALANRLKKGAFDGDDDAPTDEGDYSDDMGDGAVGADPDAGSDAELEQHLAAIKAHPRILKALAHALAELMTGAPEGSAGDSDDLDDEDLEDTGDDEDPEDESEDMSMSMKYGEPLAKALIESDSTGDLAKAIQGEPVVAAFAEYLVAVGDELFTRDDENAKVIKAQKKQIDELAKSLSSMTETVNGIAAVLVALNEGQSNIEKSMTDVANTPRIPSPGVQVVRGDGKQLAKSAGAPAAIQTEALFKALESDAGRGSEEAMAAMAIIPTNPRAAYLTLSDEARQEYDALVQA